MYSIPPAIVSLLFLCYGLFAVISKGTNRVTTSFGILCVTTFFWQATWAVLFQIKNPDVAIILIKFGYLLILFLPTSLYHFLTEISKRENERCYVYFSYGLAGILAIILLSTDLFVSGYYEYFFGYYPKAGPLHSVHLLQTFIVVMRGLYITYRQQKLTFGYQRTGLRLFIAGLFIYFFAGIDYLCNYGIEIYPLGVLFISISLGILVIAMIKYDLLNPMTIAATIAHEIRAPLATIAMQAMTMEKVWPTLYEGYQLAVQHGLCEASIQPLAVKKLADLSKGITRQVNHSTTVIDMILASANMENLDKKTFQYHSLQKCVFDVFAEYPFNSNDRNIINYSKIKDFIFYGSDILLSYALYNLIKNSLYSIKIANKGEIILSTSEKPGWNCLIFTDTGTGIPDHVRPHIFESFYSTKSGGGTGLGLSFCKRVMTSFSGNIHCDSKLGHYTTFTLEFPLAINSPYGEKSKRFLTIWHKQYVN